MTKSALLSLPNKQARPGLTLGGRPAIEQRGPNFCCVVMLHNFWSKNLCNLTIDIILKLCYTINIKRKEVKHHEKSYFNSSPQTFLGHEGFS